MKSKIRKQKKSFFGSFNVKIWIWTSQVSKYIKHWYINQIFSHSLTYYMKNSVSFKRFSKAKFRMQVNVGTGKKKKLGSLRMELKTNLIQAFLLFCHIWWFFKVEKSSNELWKVIKHAKNLTKKEEEFNLFSIVGYPIHSTTNTSYKYIVIKSFCQNQLKDKL